MVKTLELPNEDTFVWKTQKLGELLDFKNGLNYRTGDQGEEILIVGVSDFKDNFLINQECLSTVSIESLSEDYLMKEGDFLFVRSNGNKALIGRVLYAKNLTEKVTHSGFTIRARNKSDLVLNEYCAIFCSSTLIKRQFMTKGGGSNINNLNQQLLSDIEIPLPPIAEQKRIVEILSLWDKKIDLMEKLIDQKKEQNKGIMQKLLTGEIRLPGFDESWIQVKVNELIREVSERSTENNQYEVLSVTKNGIIPQNEQFNKQVASEDNIGYKVIRKNNLVFSTMNLWMGSLDVMTDYEIGIVSPAYKIFEFTKKLSPNFAKFFMKSDYMIWLYNVNSEQGASIVRRNLDLQGLFNSVVKIPALEEQQGITNILEMSEKEIRNLEKELSYLKEQKKGLMQLLLTGKVRVKV